MIRITITDDHPMVAEGIKKMLEHSDQIAIAAFYSSGQDLLEGLEQWQPDVLLLDIQLPDMPGDAIVEKIKKQYPEINILIVSSIDDPYVLQDVMRKGASGYVTKTVTPSTLTEAIQSVYYGEAYIEPALKASYMKLMMQPEQKSLKRLQLTSREKEILELICKGLSNIEIGEQLFISHRTVEHHRETLYQKFNVKNAVSLVKVAVQNKLIEE